MGIHGFKTREFLRTHKTNPSPKNKDHPTGSLLLIYYKHLSMKPCLSEEFQKVDN